MSADGSGAMFDAIAHRYDLLNLLMSGGLDRRWRAKLCASLELPREEPARVLDLATGTGDVAIALCRALPRVEVVGLDPSEQMLAAARPKLAAAGLDARVTLVAGDAQALPFEDASFDACTIAFGIRNVPDRLAALREMARVTRPGGRIALLELGEPRHGALAAIARLHVHGIVPRLGAWLSGANAYRYLERSIAAFPPPEAFMATVREAGLEPLSCEPLAFGAAHLFVARA